MDSQLVQADHRGKIQMHNWTHLNPVFCVTRIKTKNVQTNQTTMIPYYLFYIILVQIFVISPHRVLKKGLSLLASFEQISPCCFWAHLVVTAACRLTGRRGWAGISWLWQFIRPPFKAPKRPPEDLALAGNRAVTTPELSRGRREHRCLASLSDVSKIGSGVWRFGCLAVWR